MALPEEYIRRLKAMDERRSELENQMADPAVSSDPEKLKSIGREFAEISDACSLFREYRECGAELERLEAEIGAEREADMISLYEDEISALKARKESLEEKLRSELEGGKEDEDRAFIIEIRAGTGGEEAGLFAGDLFRMYTRFAENSGWKVETISSSPSALGGFKEIIFAVNGKNAFNTLKYESGVHRVQRVPVTEAGGRIHTSAATVAVLMEPDEVDEVAVDPSEIRVDTFRSTGAGGQHVNKTESAIRITHLPTGLVVECQDERSQHQNRAKAMRLLRARLMDRLLQEQMDQISKDRRTQVGSGDRSERVRTYNFPQNRVSDHRAGITLYKLETIIQGEMGALLEPLVQFMKTREEDTASKGGSG